jgi:hypothetical protein
VPAERSPVDDVDADVDADAVVVAVAYVMDCW